MSRTKPTQIEDLAVEWITCEYCGSRPGDWCNVRGTRRPSPHLHDPRTYPLWQTRSTGYQEGSVDALASLIYDLERWGWRASRSGVALIEELTRRQSVWSR